MIIRIFLLPDWLVPQYDGGNPPWASRFDEDWAYDGRKGLC